MQKSASAQKILFAPAEDIHRHQQMQIPPNLHPKARALLTILRIKNDSLTLNKKAKNSCLINIMFQKPRV